MQKSGKTARSNPTHQPPSETTEVSDGVFGLLTRTAATAARAAGEIGSDVGRFATGAAGGAIDAADRIAVAAGKVVRDLVSGTIDGIQEIMQSSAPRRPAALKPRRPIGDAARHADREPSAQRKPLARRPSRTVKKARRSRPPTANTA
ncbi:MAG: hypothetical protein C5B48_05155 [Candidatus Rokuibacteriota bacterium]|nr:MAG: hypothetical protein C5B48_05155 [Candidatus Rokubacteria bacterium]